MIVFTKHLPKIDFDNLELLPEAPGLYLVIDSANRVWYVGKSSNLQKRVTTAHEHFDDFIACECLYVCPFTLRENEIFAIDEWERANIDYYQPPINYNLKSMPVVDLGYTSEAEMLDRYADISLMLKELKAEQDQLKPNIVSILERYDRCQVKTTRFTASVTNRKRNVYSDTIKQLNEKIKEMKKLEEKDGIAQFAYSTYPTFRVIS